MLDVANAKLSLCSYFKAKAMNDLLDFFELHFYDIHAKVMIKCRQIFGTSYMVILGLFSAISQSLFVTSDAFSQITSHITVTSFLSQLFVL